MNADKSKSFETARTKDAENKATNLAVTDLKVKRVEVIDNPDSLVKNDQLKPKATDKEKQLLQLQDVNQQMANKNHPGQKEKQVTPLKQITKDKVPVQQNEIANNIERLKNEKQTNNLPKPLQNFNNEPSNITIAQNVKQTNESINVIPENRNASLTSEKDNGNQNKVVATVYNPDENVEGDDDTDNKKSKLRGLFRKVKRVFERNTNAKSGSNVMIAGFEIAVK